MAKHVQAPPQPPSVHRPGLDLELEQLILKAISKRPEDRFQTGQEFDDAISNVADRLFPGWQRSLEPGAELSRMVPGATARTAVIPATAIGITIQQPAAAVPPQSVYNAQAVYNPAPPVKPVVKPATGCVGVLAGVLPLAGLLALAAAYLH